MPRSQSLSESLVRTDSHRSRAAPPDTDPDTDFDARWAAGQARGVAHDRAVRRNLVMLAAGLAVPAAILYGLWLL